MGMIGNSLAQGLISGANIQDGTVDTPDIKDSAVTAAKIASAVITPAKLSAGAPTWDSSGNLGLGVTPSAWTTFKALELTGGAIAGIATNQFDVMHNAYYDGSFRYKTTGAAGLYQQAGAQHIWSYAASGTAGNAITFTQAMTLDASGNLGVGTTSPARRLDVRGGIGIQVNEDGAGTKVITIRSDYAGVDPAINVTTNNALLLMTNNTERARIDSSGNFLIGQTGAASALLTLADSSSGKGIGWGTTSANYANIWAAYSSGDLVLGGNVYGSSSADSYLSSYGGATPRAAMRISAFGGYISFATAGSTTTARGTAVTLTEAARIDSSGNFLFSATGTGNANPGIHLRPNGTETANTPRLDIVGAASTVSNTIMQIYSSGAAAYRFYIQWNGQIYATQTSIIGISDRSLKTNIRDLDTGLTQVMALKPRRFDWINGDASDVAGFVAQEVEEVLPELVYDYKYSKDADNDDVDAMKKGLKMGDMLPTLVKAIQEQQAIITALTARIEALEGA